MLSDIKDKERENREAKGCPVQLSNHLAAASRQGSGESSGQHPALALQTSFHCHSVPSPMYPMPSPTLRVAHLPLSLQNGAWWLDVYIGLEEVWESQHHPGDLQCSPSSPWYLHTLGKHLLQGLGSKWHPGIFAHWIQLRVCWNLGQNCLKGWVCAKSPPVLGKAAVGMFPSCSLLSFYL